MAPVKGKFQQRRVPEKDGSCKGKFQQRRVPEKDGSCKGKFQQRRVPENYGSCQGKFQQRRVPENHDSCKGKFQERRVPEKDGSCKGWFPVKFQQKRVPEKDGISFTGTFLYRNHSFQVSISPTIPGQQLRNENKRNDFQLFSGIFRYFQIYFQIFFTNIRIYLIISSLLCNELK